ncbi:MAG: thiamine pyrophosphate-binding protein, partial [Ignavibacteriae bacterium]|nr:thiamine pyrophosphate-binding protein [Ignavibacteriota bacterium]
KDQRLFTNSGSASMGYDLPGAIGASVAIQNTQDIICFAGDGSIMMNLQELQTIVTNKLRVKIVIFNNQGYLSIKQTHDNFFNGVLVGCNPSSGVEFPSFKKISNAFEIPYFSLLNHDNIDDKIIEFLSYNGVALLEVFIDPNQSFEPKSASMRLEDGSMVSRPLEDLAPFLDRDELKLNMLVPMI